MLGVLQTPSLAKTFTTTNSVIVPRPQYRLKRLIAHGASSPIPEHSQLKLETPKGRFTNARVGRIFAEAGCE